MVNAVSAMAMFRTARRRLLSEIERWLARERSRRVRPELRVAFNDERRREGQPLRAHHRVGRYRTPLADRRSSGERRVARAEAICCPPGEYRLRDLCAPRNSTLP